MRESTAGSVEAVEITRLPLPVSCACADHGNMLSGIERPAPGELHSKGIEAAECSPREPYGGWPRHKLNRLIKPIKCCYMIAVKKYHCMWSVNTNLSVSIPPVFVVIDCGNHCCFDLAHD